MDNKELTKETKRFYVLDLMRGIAVFLMLFAHAVYFFHNRTNSFLVGTENFANTVAFTLFLVVSGAVAYIAYFGERGCEGEKRKKIIKRSFALLFSYYLLALIVISGQLFSSIGFEKIKLVLDILLFKNTPSYTEFIAPFVFYSFLIIFLHKFFDFISKSVIWAIAVSVYVYAMGAFLSTVSFPAFLDPWKALLFGSAGYYRFPLFQYLPIFILGVCWGYWLKKTSELRHKREISEFLFAIFLVGVLSSILTGYIIGKPFELLSLRWPPSIPFLFLGLSFTFFCSTIIYYLKQLKNLPLTRDVLLLLGQNAFALFWAHTFLLNLYAMSGGTKVGSTIAFFFLFALIVILSLALATFIPFNFKFSLTFYKGTHDEQEELIEKTTVFKVGDELYEETRAEMKKLRSFFFPRHTGKVKQERLIKKRHFLAGVLITLIFSLSAFALISEEVGRASSAGGSNSWLFEEYGYRQNVVVENNESFSNIPSKSMLKFTLDHKSLVETGKALPQGQDIKLVWWDGKKSSDVNFRLSNGWNLNNSELLFEVPQEIKSGQKSQSLWIYYGNSLPKQTGQVASAKELWKYRYKASLQKEERHSPFLSSSRKWVLKSPNANSEPLSLTLNSGDDSENISVEAQIVGTDNFMRMEKVDSYLWQGKIEVKNLAPGEYFVQAIIYKGQEVQKSQKVGFHLSYPVYVSWTIDWEGYDTSVTYLDAMARIADTHGMPMTHLFNPRIYVSPSISQSRAEYLTNWVKAREENAREEIGLHLHLFKDLTESAGVQYKNDNSWGDSGDGYGTLPSNYTQQELERIISYSVSLLKEHGLGKPVSYRAGGWFANLDLLKALQNQGLLIDSSGRTSYRFGSRQAQGYWSLPETAQPYHPSFTNQNAQLDKNLSIWEVPNNGADSYWFSSQDMISRFKKNYPGGIAKNPISIVYLSHPHWFKPEEQEKIRSTLSNSDTYLYTKDAGPVVYVTLSTIYEDYLKGE